MKVLLLNQYFPPDEAATAQMLGDLVESLCAHGMSCEVVTSNRSYANPARRYPRRGSWRGARVRRIAMTGFGRRSKLGRLVDYATFLAGATLALLTAERPDVIVGLSTPPILGSLAVAVGRLRRVRSAYWTMDVYPDVAFELGVMERHSLAGRVFATVSRWAFRSADTVVALGDGDLRAVVLLHHHLNTAARGILVDRRADDSRGGPIGGAALRPPRGQPRLWPKPSNQSTRPRGVAIRWWSSRFSVMSRSQSFLSSGLGSTTL